jgi:hypothetical protein
VPTLTPGMLVRVPFGPGTVNGRIIEDRGPVGARGRHLYTVEVPSDPDDPFLLVLAADDIEDDYVPDEPIEPDEVREFLLNAGLISILRRNMLGGANQPSAWLCRDTLGNVTFTTHPDRGMIGGSRIPFFARRGERVFTPKRDEVVAFVESFGLSRDAAEEVVEAVGTAP